jgi:hypothetical protein
MFELFNEPPFEVADSNRHPDGTELTCSLEGKIANAGVVGTARKLKKYVVPLIVVAVLLIAAAVAWLVLRRRRNRSGTITPHHPPERPPAAPPEDSTDRPSSDVGLPWEPEPTTETTEPSAAERPPGSHPPD